MFGINDDSMREIASVDKVLKGYRIPDWRREEVRGDKLAKDAQGDAERKILDLLVAKAAS